MSITTVSHRHTAYRNFKGMSLCDHYFEVPLDYTVTDSPTIKVFAREVVDIKQADNAELPWVVYFQGGLVSSQPTNHPWGLDRRNFKNAQTAFTRPPWHWPELPYSSTIARTVCHTTAASRLPHSLPR